MLPLICPHCGGRMEVEERPLVSFACPYCAGAVAPSQNGKAWILTPGPPGLGGEAAPQAQDPVNQAKAQLLTERAKEEKDPRRQHELLSQAEKLSPDSLAVQSALLYLGRLHERTAKRVDFSVIKCYLLHAFDRPEEHTPAQREAMLTELFHHPRLKKCLALAPDPEAFMKEYLENLCGQYIALFLKGNNLYMRPFFGFSTGKPEKLLAAPAARIIRAIREDERLEPIQRALLSQAFYAAFSKEMAGHTEYLDGQMPGGA